MSQSGQEVIGKESRTGAIVILAVCVVVLFAASLIAGPVKIPFREILSVLTGKGASQEIWNHIILENRLPQAVTALLGGAALAISGLLLQFRHRCGRCRFLSVYVHYAEIDSGDILQTINGIL